VGSGRGRRRLRFDGWIAGVGLADGTRLVLGHWPRSPFGPVSDVMVQQRNGERLLLAETEPLGRFVAETYSFDEVRIVPTRVVRSGPEWLVSAGPLTVRFTTGGRGGLGWLLRAVPEALAGHPAWARAVDLPARLVLSGVRTYGTAGNRRREWYGAHDLHRIASARASLHGVDLGELTAVDPPVRFGFGSTPRRPALVRITTTVEVPAN
jgi:hypothetical protein